MGVALAPDSWWRRLIFVLLRNLGGPCPYVPGPPNRVRHGAATEQSARPFHRSRSPRRPVPNPAHALGPDGVPSSASLPSGPGQHTRPTSGGGPQGRRPATVSYTHLTL